MINFPEFIKNHYGEHILVEEMVSYKTRIPLTKASELEIVTSGTSPHLKMSVEPRFESRIKSTPPMITTLDQDHLSLIDQVIKYVNQHEATIEAMDKEMGVQND